MAQILADRRDVDFVLHEQLNVGQQLAQHERFSDFNRKAIDLVISEARNLAVKEILPTQADGDRLGVHFENGKVTVPQSFHKAWKALRDGEWFATTENPELGGQGMPRSVAVAGRRFPPGGEFPVPDVHDALARRRKARRDVWIGEAEEALPEEGLLRRVERDDDAHRAERRIRRRRAHHHRHTERRRHLLDRRQQDLHLGRRARPVRPTSSIPCWRASKALPRGRPASPSSSSRRSGSTTTAASASPTTSSAPGSKRRWGSTATPPARSPWAAKESVAAISSVKPTRACARCS